MDILLASVILVIVVKTAVVAVVTKVFGYSIRTSFLVSCLSKISSMTLIHHMYPIYDLVIIFQCGNIT